MRAVSLLAALLWAGCAAIKPPLPSTDPVVEQRARAALRAMCPRGVRLTQRAIVNAAGRQFSCDGMLQIAADGGLRMALLAPMGVIAELRARPDGTTEVVKTAPSFHESWARECVAGTARLLFAVDEAELRVGRGADGRPVLWREAADGTRWLYAFSADGGQWQEAEVSQGWQRLLHATGMPGGFRVRGSSFELELRTVGR